MPPRFQPWSIRQTIFLLYALILLLTFSLFGGAIYFYFQREIYNKVDTLLDVKANGLEESIRTYLRTRPAPKAAPATGWASLFAKPEVKEEKEATFFDVADFLTENKLPLSEEPLHLYSDIFDSEGGLIASSGTPPLVTMTWEIRRGVLRGERHYYTYSEYVKKGSPLKTRALIHPIMENGQVLYLIQTRVSLKSVQEQLGRIGRFLATLVFAILFIASWAGILFVNVTLLPVNKMVRKIHTIRPEDLSGRLNLPHTHDEIRDLAHTFNEMLARVEKSFVTQKQILQNLSHELKTPLTVIRGQINVALKKPRSASEYRALLQSNLEEIARLRRIMDDLLMLARLDSHTAAIKFDRVNLAWVAQSVLEDARVLAAEKEIAVDYSGPEMAWMEGNEMHLRRLLSNLLDNAVKYTPHKGHIRVWLESSAYGVRLEIRDDGIGIPEDQLPHVFDRFYRAENAVTETHGYGLGLSIVKSIVDAHQGEIRVESEPGRGTVFSILFPERIAAPLF